MRGGIQSLPSSRRLPFLPRVFLPVNMNLKNFPKKLDSKTSCLRITVPENLDLALEGLIRKVLREQPKVDDIYAFAADYFDALLKIRDKAGKKFTAEQLCPFHNDEDAHEMIKLASTFPKPENFKTNPLELDKSKNTDSKIKRKKFAKPTGKPEKMVQYPNQPAVVSKKPKKAIGVEKNQKLHETKPERPKTLLLEPKTEDVGEDEEFLKSDPIKVLVEKELMDAGKSLSKDEKEGVNDKPSEQENSKLEIGGVSDLRTDVDKDGVVIVEGNPEEKISNTNDEKTELKNVTEDTGESKGDVKEENMAVDEEKLIIQDAIQDQAPTEPGEEVLNATKNEKREETELEDDVKYKQENQNPDVEKEIPETNKVNDHSKAVESSGVEAKSQLSLENKIKEEAKNDIDSETNQEELKETSKEQDTATGIPEEFLQSRNEEEAENIKTDTQEDSKCNITEGPSTVEEANFNPDELCTVVDIHHIKSHEAEKAEKEGANSNSEKIDKTNEAELREEEKEVEIKIKSEEQPPKEEKEVGEIQKSVEAVEEGTVADKTEGENVFTSSIEVEAQQKGDNFAPEKVEIIEEPANVENSIEKSEVQAKAEDKESENETMKGKGKNNNLEETESAPFGDQKLTEDNAENEQDGDATETTKVIKNNYERHIAPEENLIEEVGNSKATIGNKATSALIAEEIPVELLESKEHSNMPEKVEEARGHELKTEDIESKSDENSVDKEDPQNQKGESKTDESIQILGNTNHNEINSDVHEKKSFEKPSDVAEKQIVPEKDAEEPETEKGIGNETGNPQTGVELVKNVEDKMEAAEKEVISEEKKEEESRTQDVWESDKVEQADLKDKSVLENSGTETLVNVEELAKPVHESEKSATAGIDAEVSTALEQSTHDAEPNHTVTEGEVPTTADAQHVIKAEEADGGIQETSQPEGVQIKTIQTHYYDTLQVPEQITKEYRVRSVKNDNDTDKEETVANATLAPSADGNAGVVKTSLDFPNWNLDKSDLEDSLMTPSSDYSLNVSELSVRTINEMFLNAEKQFSVQDRIERRDVTETGKPLEHESDAEKREVEETFHKTTVQSAIEAIPVAPRDDAEINEEANIDAGLQSVKKEDPSVNLRGAVGSSNEGESIDSDTPIISVEVKTVIETQVSENENKAKDEGEETRGVESDVQIRIEATIDVPEGVILELRERAENKDEVRQHASEERPTWEGVPKDSQTSSGESESTISSAATEIKRSDSAKRHFSSTRTLITTQSLEFDKRNPLLKTRSLTSFRQGVTDFEVWNAIEKELEEAATKIQSNFRGYKTRKKLQRENAVQITTEESSCSTTPVEPEPKEERQQSTGEFHDSIVLSEYPR